MTIKKENYYENLKSKRDEKRKSEPEPKYVPGTFLPCAVSEKVLIGGDPLIGKGWNKVEILRNAIKTLHRFTWADVIRTAEELGGWEKLIIALEKNQKQGVFEAAKGFRKKLGLKSNDLHDMRVVSVAGCTAIGFEIDNAIEHTADREVGLKHWCPMVQGIREMGYEDSPIIDDFQLWCDLYDNFEVDATNANICFTHTHCLARRGDKYCRYCVDYREKVPGENYYQYLKKWRDIKRAEADAEAGGDISATFRPGLTGSTPIDNTIGRLSLEEKLEMGVQIHRRVAVATVITGAEMLGWERFINGMIEKEIPRLRERARNLGQKWDITGNTACDGAILMNIGMLGLGFDDHQLISWSEKRVEGIARSCPIVESAKESHLEGKLQDISLWCDAWHGAIASSMNKKLSCTFTHCLGKGDKLCRWIIE